jgi:formate hydrogenlyase subunit 6/NADH:ubiquinone oxidoreductase subunit I
MAAALPVVDYDLCDRCGLCVEACPCHAVEMTERGPVFHCAEECGKSGTCSADCGLVCEEVCPRGAISCSFEITIEDDCTVNASNDEGSHQS